MCGATDEEQKPCRWGKEESEEGVKHKATFQDECVCLYVLKCPVGSVSVWLQDIFYWGAAEWTSQQMHVYESTMRSPKPFLVSFAE